ncbi:MAG: hypothetical protein WC683_12635 [bacterium]
MGAFWVDVYEAGGGVDDVETLLGSGPITTASDWESTAVLDGAGSFSFAVPATDPQAALLSPRRIVWAFMMDRDGVRQELGSGIIKRVAWEAGQPPMLRVSGCDLLGELADRTVGELEIQGQAWTYIDDVVVGEYVGTVRSVNTSGQQDRPYACDGDLGTVTGVIDIEDHGELGGDYLYIGYDARFDQAYFYIDTVNAAYALMRVQYYTSAGWEDITVTDGTAADIGGGETAMLGKNGAVVWERPSDWARVAAVEPGDTWFYIRISRQDDIGNNITVKLEEVAVYADLPTTDGVNLIMNHAPDGWQGTYPQTEAAHYTQFKGESVLAALVSLAESGGQTT